MRRLLVFVVLVVGCVVGHGARAGAFPGAPWRRPVDGPVVRAFDPPTTRFGPGHLGVDFGVAPGTPVRAAGDGVVVFAGRVGSGLHVVVLHAGDVRTTDSFLASVAVVRGQRVARGALLGTSGGTGPQHSAHVLHFGVRVGDEYVDPMLLFTPPDLGRVVHLAEPHGGSFGGSALPSFPAPPSASDPLVLATELRIDARPPVRPPPWWPSAATNPPRAGPVSAAATVRGSGRARRRSPAPALAVGAAAPMGGLVVLRRRSRASRRADGR